MCGRRDLNPHAEALDPKSSVSANFTTLARCYKCQPLTTVILKAFNRQPPFVIVTIYFCSKIVNTFFKKSFLELLEICCYTIRIISWRFRSADKRSKKHMLRAYRCLCSCICMHRNLKALAQYLIRRKSFVL